MAFKNLWSSGKLKVMLVLAVALGVVSCSCGQDDPTRDTDPKEPVAVTLPGSDDSYLPVAIMFSPTGDPVPITFNQDGGVETPRQLTDKDFPLQAKIRTVKNITMVVYDGSCNVMTYSKDVGYYLVTIHDDAVCAFINP